MYEGTKALGRKPNLVYSEILVTFHAPWTRISIPNTDPDPRQLNDCESTRPDPDPQHRFFTRVPDTKHFYTDWFQFHLTIAMQRSGYGSRYVIWNCVTYNL
jgi:hypothetical protein